MKSSNRKFVVLLVGILCLSACTNAQTPIEETPVLATVPAGPNNGYPATNPVTSNYPVPQTSGGASYAYPGDTSNYLPTLPVGQLPSAPVDAPQPQTGKASLSGTVFSFTSYMVIPETTAYLSPALGDNKEFPPLLTGPNPAAGDIQGRTDSQGQLWLDNILPGDYYLVVWAPYSWTPVVDTSTDAYTPLLFTFEADQAYPLGVLQVSWP